MAITFIFLFLPETKGHSVEEITALFEKPARQAVPASLGAPAGSGEAAAPSGAGPRWDHDGGPGRAAQVERGVSASRGASGGGRGTSEGDGGSG